MTPSPSIMQARQHTNFEPNPSSPTVFSSTSPSSSPTSSSSSSSSSSSAPNSVNAATIVFVMLGALIGVSLMSYMTYRLVRRFKSRKQRSLLAEEGVMVNEKGYGFSEDLAEDEQTLVDQPGTIGSRRSQFNSSSNIFSFLTSPWSGTNGSEAVTTTKGSEKVGKRVRKITLYKVKRNKKGDSFEIDEVEDNSSLVDLPLKDSDMH